jgi:hypothetical protein
MMSVVMKAHYVAAPLGGVFHGGLSGCVPLAFSTGTPLIIHAIRGSALELRPPDGQAAAVRRHADRPRGDTQRAHRGAAGAPCDSTDEAGAPRDKGAFTLHIAERRALGTTIRRRETARDLA